MLDALCSDKLLADLGNQRYTGLRVVQSKDK